MTDVLEILPGTVEYRLKQMEENVKAMDITNKLPECPVIYNILSQLIDLYIIRCALKSLRKTQISSTASMVTMFVETANQGCQEM